MRDMDFDRIKSLKGLVLQDYVICNIVLLRNKEKCLIFSLFKHLQRQFISLAKLYQSYIYNEININFQCLPLSASFSSAILLSLKIQYVLSSSPCV